MKDDVIDESFGGNLGTTAITPYSALNYRTTDNMRQDVKLANKQNIKPKPFSLTGWQANIKRHVILGNDIFVNVSPAGGKSFPIESAFEELLFNAKGWRDVPVLVWIGETKTLASELYYKFREFFYSRLMEVVKTKDANGNDIWQPALPNFMIEGTGLDFTPNPSQQIKLSNQEHIKRLVNMWTSLMIGANDKQRPQPPGSKHRTIIMACSYVFAPNLIKHHNPKIVVIDEIQERFQIDKDKDSDKKIGYLINTIKETPRSACLAILTGSMNHDTSKFISLKIKQLLNRELIPISTDTAKNRASIGIFPISLLPRNIPDLAHNLIVEKTSHSLITLFSKNKIEALTKGLISKLPRRKPEVLFGKLQQFPKYGQPDKTTDIKAPGEDFKLQRNKEFTLDEMYDWHQQMLDPNKKGDTLLGEALLHGFGYIMSVGDSEAEKDKAYFNKDIQTVIRLFDMGKIDVVIATTSVGVGVNLNVKHLFIPTIKMFTGGGFKNMSVSTLVQMINRAGRKSGTFANIYCDNSDISQITSLINSGDPSSQVPVIPFKGGSDSIHERFSKGNSLRTSIGMIHDLMNRSAGSGIRY